MTIEQIIVIAVVQGITEFLPISSSGHLVLVPYLFHWPDQGQFVDVMVHLGTLFAILIYFWRDVWKITLGALDLFKGKVTREGKLAIYIVLATIPAVAFGLLLKKFGFGSLERSVTVVAWNTVIYGILMLIADMMGKQEKTIEDMTLKIKRTVIHDGSAINFGATVMGGAVIEKDTTLSPLSMVLKEMYLSSGTYEGSPTELAGQLQTDVSPILNHKSPDGTPHSNKLADVRKVVG